MSAAESKERYLGHRQNCRRVEAGKNAARPSYRSARWNGLIEGRCQEGESNRSAAGRTARDEARRHDAGGQKATVSGDEKTLGGAQKEGILRAASLPGYLIEGSVFDNEARFPVAIAVNRQKSGIAAAIGEKRGRFDQTRPLLPANRHGPI